MTAHPADPRDEPVVVTDRRRIDPQTGAVRPPAGAAAAEPAGAPVPPVDEQPLPAGEGAEDAALLDEQGLADVTDEAAAAVALAEERLGDLQRLQAEYVNYRRRVDRDRDVARGTAVAGVFEALLPVLDDVALARQHGDLDGGPFAAIAEKLDAVLGRLGLSRYGEVGEVFDPAVHEALLDSTDASVAQTTVTAVLQPGYRVAERVLRPARVAVTSPA